jgi:REP element-mobilizing transposase RayT
MPNHIHLIISSNDIIKFVKEFKSYTARAIIKQLKSDNNIEMLKQFIYGKKDYKKESTYQLWQEGYHPEYIYNMIMFNQKADYIHNNPVRKGLVTRPEEWKYSSATNYILGKGIIEIDSPV